MEVRTGIKKSIDPDCLYHIVFKDKSSGKHDKEFYSRTDKYSPGTGQEVKVSKRLFSWNVLEPEEMTEIIKNLQMLSDQLQSISLVPSP